MDFNSVFDGIGTELISILIGIILGGIGGYFIGVIKNSKQTQTAHDNAIQNQSTFVENNSINNKKNKSKKIGLDHYEYIKIVRKWWDSIGVSFNITSVGRILAHSNALRCDNTLPPINKIYNLILYNRYANFLKTA